ncbi:hypothetical protein [Streptomyces macrolidinus]|uniref:hypothetical protein n=1 Tax=Streptomyces macrolidinus TaxID=2952607 RepID=UPI003556A938
MVNKFGKSKAQSAIKDFSRVLGHPSSHGERITKVLRRGRRDPAEIRERAGCEDGHGHCHGGEGPTRGTGGHTAAVILYPRPG